MLTLIGLLRLGSLIRYIPHAVAVGFTCGIAVTILASQLKDLGGLTLAGVEPGSLFPKLAMLSQALPTLSPAAFGVGIGSAAVIFVLRHWRPTWPGMLIAVVAASIAALLLHLPIETIGNGRYDMVRSREGRISTSSNLSDSLLGHCKKVAGISVLYN